MIANSESANGKPVSAATCGVDDGADSPPSTAGTIARVPIGRVGLPNGIQRSIFTFRRSLESAVVAAHGEVGFAHALLIHAAVVAWGESRRAALRLAEAHAGKRVLTEEQTAAWSDRRVRHLKDVVKLATERLGLDRHDTRDIFDKIYENIAANQQQENAQEARQATQPENGTTGS